MTVRVNKKKLEAVKKELMGGTGTPEEEAVEETAPAFGGGYLVGLIVNPSPEELVEVQGFDADSLSLSRSYGGNVYLPLLQYCKNIDNAAGRSKAGDRFMLKRDTAPPFTEAEESMYQDAHIIGQQLLDKGAVGPIVFVRVQVIGHSGPEVLKNHYIPSCGIANGPNEILAAFKLYMSKPQRWIFQEIV